MKKIKKAAIAVLLLLFIVVFSVSASAEVVSAEIPESGDYNSESSDMVTESFNVEMDVHENNSFDVTEAITINFKDNTHHGFYRNIPYKGKIFRSVDGNDIEKNYRMKITDIKLNGYNFETYNENGNVVIQVGDKDRTVTGEQRYVISYKVRLNDDEIDSQDMVYWNFLPSFWETSIASASLTVNMPKEFNPDDVEVLSGYSGEISQRNFKVSINGKSIKATTVNGLKIKQGATLNVVLPEGYFTGEKTDDYLWYIIAGVMAVSFLVLFLLWFFVGRDKKVIPVVSFYPPEGMTSAEIGYIIDGMVDDRDLVSLIIYWADKGYLKITDCGKKKFRLEKLQDLPEDAKNFEKTLFGGLFKERDEVSADELSENFYTTFESSKSMLNNYFTGNKENNLYTGKSVVARVFSHLLMIIPAAAAIFGSLYIKVADTGWYILSVLMMVMFVIASLAAAFNFDRRNAMSKPKYTASMIFISAVVIFTLLVLCVAGMIGGGNIPLTAAGIVLTSIGFILMLRMKTLTDKGVRWRGEVIGFRDFITTAELDRLKTLVDDNPEYFYNVLPYAYALGITDKWSKQFESIAVQPPVWYSTSYRGSDIFTTMLFMNSFDRCMTGLDRDMRSHPAVQDSSSSGFGGGGLSGGGFSGGGGFTGGGFGGGGGGSW